MRVLALAVVLDACLGEPPAVVHPVVWMGRLLDVLERRAPAGSSWRLIYGALAATLVPCGWAALAHLAARRLPWPMQALLLKPCFAGRALVDASRQVESALRNDDLAKARMSLKTLVSRPTANLDAALVSAAAIESLAENFVDSWLAPLLMYAVGGLPLAYAYRAANTADATWGYRNARFEYLGKGAARLDDLLNLVPARLATIMLALSSGAPRRSVAVWWRDSCRTQSPNAGQAMAAAAGALDVRLEKINHYVLHEAARMPNHMDITRARALVRRAMVISALVCLVRSR